VRSFADVDALCSAEGSDLGYGDWVVVSQDRFGSFKAAIHDLESSQVHPSRTASKAADGDLARDYLMLSLMSRLCAGLIDLQEKRMTVNYGLNQVRFLAPTPVGARIRARARLTSATRTRGGVQIVLDVEVEQERGRQPLCSAQTVRLFYV